MATRTYQPGEVSVIVGGSPIKGRMNVSVEFLTERYAFDEDVDGSLTRVENSAWRHAQIMITMNQGSSDNLILSGLFAAGLVIPVIIKDNSGNSIFTMAEGTIIKMPTSAFGAETADREWIVEGLLELSVDGGN